MVQKTNRAQRVYQAQIISALENIYISPLETCNLQCRACYTAKTKSVLSNQQILNFIKKYNNFLKENSVNTIFSNSSFKKNHLKKSLPLSLKSILFCGGEVFTLPDFSKLVNTLTQKDIFITIITNGTIDHLKDIKNPNNCQILVSLDGPQAIHDQNRGQGNFLKSINYIKHAQKLGFPVGVMFLITKDSYSYKDSFLNSLDKLYNLKNLSLTYITDRRLSLTNSQCLDIKLHYSTFPTKNFGCFQLSLQSTGHITGCCESNLSLGQITDNPKIFINNFINSLSACLSCSTSNLVSNCNGCCQPNYLCGYLQEFNKLSCQDIINLFSKKL